MSADRNLAEWSDAIHSMVDDVAQDLIDAGFETSPMVSSGPMECREGLNTRNGTFEERWSFRVTGGARRAIEETVRGSWQRQGIEIDELDTGDLLGERDGARFGLTFPIDPSADEATVSGSNPCAP